MCTRNALSYVLQEFAAQNPLEMAARSGAILQGDKIILDYCNLSLVVTYPGGEMDWQQPEDKVVPPGITHEEKVVILKYLTAASGLPARGQWLSFHELRGGNLHWKPFHREALEPLARSYHQRAALFMELGKRHGGKPFNEGDAGIVIPILPRLMLAFVLWKGGGEFMPRSTILFDTVAEAYLPTAALYVLAIQAVVRIWFPGDTRYD